MALTQKIHKKLKIILVMVFVLLPFSLKAESLKILIDPGHGGVDQGAHAGTLKESDLTLQISKILKTELDKDSSFKTYLTRNSDIYLSLETRVKRVDEIKADILLSIHANSSLDKNLKGFEIYFANNLNLTEESFLAEPTKSNDILMIVQDLKRQSWMENSLKLSSEIMQNCENNPEPKNIKQGPFYVLNQSKATAVLLELGYMSNPEDLKDFQDPQKHKKWANSIYKALLSYRENLEKDNKLALKLK
jgi:N-acetylmuramoyl-L-alanine amidase